MRTQQIEITKILSSMEDAAVGQHLLILKGPFVEVPQGYTFFGGPPAPQEGPKRVRDRGSEGCILKVLAIELPFIAVQVVNRGGAATLFDLRDGAVLKSIGEEFVKALTTQTTQQQARPAYGGPALSDGCGCGDANCTEGSDDD